MDNLQKEKIEIDIQEKELQTKEFVQSFGMGKRILLLALVLGSIPIFLLAKYGVAALYYQGYMKIDQPAHVSITNAQPVKVLETKILNIVDNNYSAYALIKNPNSDFSTSDLEYTFKIYDASNKEIFSKSDSSFILKGEQKYIILPNVKLSSEPNQIKFEIKDPEWSKRTELPNVTLQNSLPAFADQNDPQGFAINGSVTNQSAFTLHEVKVSSVIIGSGEVIAVTQTKLSDLKPHETRDYKLFWPVKIGSYVTGEPKIYSETNLLDQNNLR